MARHGKARPARLPSPFRTLPRTTLQRLAEPLAAAGLPKPLSSALCGAGVAELGGLLLDDRWRRRLPERIIAKIDAAIERRGLLLVAEGLRWPCHRKLRLRLCRAIRRGAAEEAHEILRGCARPTSWSVAPVAAIDEALRRLVPEYGMIHLDDVHAALSAAGLEADRLETTLALHPEFEWIDRRKGWFWLGARYAAKRRLQLQKIFALAPRLPLPRLAAALYRTAERGLTAPDLEAFSRFLGRFPDLCRIDGMDAVAVAPRPEEQVLDESERRLVAVLKANGGFAISSAIERPWLLATGKGCTAFRALLAKTPILEAHGKGIYGLVGVTPPPGALEDEAARREPQEIVGTPHWDGALVKIPLRLTLSVFKNRSVKLPRRIAERLLQGDDCVGFRTPLGEMRLRSSGVLGGLTPVLRCTNIDDRIDLYLDRKSGRAAAVYAGR